MVDEDRSKLEEKLTETMIYAEGISRGLHDLKQIVKEKTDKYELT